MWGTTEVTESFKSAAVRSKHNWELERQSKKKKKKKKPGRVVRAEWLLKVCVCSLFYLFDSIPTSLMTMLSLYRKKGEVTLHFFVQFTSIHTHFAAFQSSSFANSDLQNLYDLKTCE